MIDDLSECVPNLSMQHHHMSYTCIRLHSLSQNHSSRLLAFGYGEYLSQFVFYISLSNIEYVVCYP